MRTLTLLLALCGAAVAAPAPRPKPPKPVPVPAWVGSWKMTWKGGGYTAVFNADGTYTCGSLAGAWRVDEYGRLDVEEFTMCGTHWSWQVTFHEGLRGQTEDGQPFELEKP